MNKRYTRAQREAISKIAISCISQNKSFEQMAQELREAGLTDLKGRPATAQLARSVCLFLGIGKWGMKKPAASWKEWSPSTSKARYITKARVGTPKRKYTKRATATKDIDVPVTKKQAPSDSVRAILALDIDDTSKLTVVRALLGL